MASQPEAGPDWGHEYGLVASEKWKAKSAAMGTPATEALVEYASPVAGMRVLDLASGTGEPAITLATRVGPQGSVTALDLSQDLLEIAEKRARSRGLKNFRTQKADAHSLPFPDDSFDVGTSRFGVMFFRDPSKALGELRRVLRPGARACFLAWGGFDQPYWKSMMGVVHRNVGGPLLPPDGARSISFCRAGQFIRGAAAGWLWLSRGTERDLAVDLARTSRRGLATNEGGRRAISPVVGSRPRTALARNRR